MLYKALVVVKERFLGHPKNPQKVSKSPLPSPQIQQNSSQPVDFEGDFLEFLMMSQKSFLDNYYAKISTRKSLEKCHSHFSNPVPL